MKSSKSGTYSVGWHNGWEYAEEQRHEGAVEQSVASRAESSVDDGIHPISSREISFIKIVKLDQIGPILGLTIFDIGPIRYYIMMSINKHSDYAIVILTYFSKNPAELVSAKGLSASLKLPHPMVSKLLKILVKANLLSSIQGARGGYRLNKSAEDISIASVIEAVEGPIAMTECSTGDHSGCHVQNSCSIKPHWVIINSVIKDSLSKLTLSSLTQTRPTSQTLYNLSSKPVSL